MVLHMNGFWEDPKRIAQYGILLGGISAVSWYIMKLHERISLLEKYSNLKPKCGMIGLIGNTPIIELKSLSEFTGCRIYVI